MKKTIITLVVIGLVAMAVLFFAGYANAQNYTGYEYYDQLMEDYGVQELKDYDQLLHPGKYIRTEIQRFSYDEYLDEWTIETYKSPVYNTNPLHQTGCGTCGDFQPNVIWKGKYGRWVRDPETGLTVFEQGTWSGR